MSCFTCESFLVTRVSAACGVSETSLREQCGQSGSRELSETSVEQVGIKTTF